MRAHCPSHCFAMIERYTSFLYIPAAAFCVSLFTFFLILFFSRPKVSVNGVNVPFVRMGAVLAKRKAPPTAQWYYAFEEDEGLGPVIDLPASQTDAPITVVVTASTDAATVEKVLNGGVYGTLIRAIYAHANVDLDRSNPDSNSPGPAYVSSAYTFFLLFPPPPPPLLLLLLLLLLPLSLLPLLLPPPPPPPHPHPQYHHRHHHHIIIIVTITVHADTPLNSRRWVWLSRSSQIPRAQQVRM